MAIELDKMSVAEKVHLMEAIWESLCRKPVDVESPEWHSKILAERTGRLASGEATVSLWQDAKKRLQDLES